MCLADLENIFILLAGLIPCIPSGTSEELKFLFRLRLPEQYCVPATCCHHNVRAALFVGRYVSSLELCIHYAGTLRLVSDEHFGDRYT